MGVISQRALSALAASTETLVVDLMERQGTASMAKLAFGGVTDADDAGNDHL